MQENINYHKLLECCVYNTFKDVELLQHCEPIACVVSVCQFRKPIGPTSFSEQINRPKANVALQQTQQKQSLAF